MERFHTVPIVIICLIFLTRISCYNLNQNNLYANNWPNNNNGYGLNNGFGYGGSIANTNNNYNPHWPFNGPYGPFDGPYGPFNGPYGPFDGPYGPFNSPNGPFDNRPMNERSNIPRNSPPPSINNRRAHVPPFRPPTPPNSNYNPIYRQRDVESITEGPNFSKDREPIDIDVVSGTIGDPDDTQFELAKPHTGGFPPLGSYPFDTSTIFQHTFGDFFGNVQPNNGFPGFGQFPKPWWQGPNVCTDREENIEEQTSNKKGDEPTSISSSSINGNSQSMFVSSGSFNLNFESCYEKPNKHVCKKVTNKQGVVKTVTVTHQCCHGFARVNNVWNSVCEKIDLVSVQEAAEKFGAKEFVRSAMSNGLEDELKKNITVFAPIDEAFTDFSEHNFETNLVVVPLRRSRRETVDSSVTSTDIILAHVVEDWVNIEDIENEQILNTAYKNSTIRMNIFPRPPTLENYKYPYRYTANCAPISKANQISTNGIVHVVDKVLPPVTKNLYEVISERRDMTILKSILDKTKLDKLLKNEKALTFFAPTDSAFEKLDPSFKKSLKDGNGCATNIIKNHILDLTFCSCAVVEDAKTSTINILGEKLNFEQSNGKSEEQANEIADLVGTKDIIINGKSHIIEADLMGTNGVIHVVDNILPTDSGLPIGSMLEKQNLTIFKRLIEAGNLQEQFDSMSNVTFFAPSDKAFETSKWAKLLEENPSKLKNNLELKEFLEYHIAEPMIKTCDFTENDIHTKVAGNDLRINLYTTHPIFTNIMNRATVNCARLIHFDDESCGSVLHQVDKTLEPPKYNLLEQLESNPSYSMFLRLIKEANLTELLQEADQDLTIFVPKDDVFREVQDWYDEIFENKPHLATIVKAHILPDVMCCAGIVPSDWPFIRSVETINNIHLKLDRDRRPKIQNAGITKCDVNAKNGIIHEINDIITIRQRTYQQQPPTFW